MNGSVWHAAKRYPGLVRATRRFLTGTMQLSHGWNTDETPMADTLVTRCGAKAGTLFGGLFSRQRTEQTDFPVGCFIRVPSVAKEWFRLNPNAETDLAPSRQGAK